MNKAIIVGMGLFGKQLAFDLIDLGAEVVAVDNNMELIEEVKDSVTYAVRLDSTDEKSLESLGLNDFDMGIVCIGEDFEANLLTAVLLKKLGVKLVITRASDPIHVKILEAVGVDRIISPETDAATKLAYSLIHRHIVDIVSLGDFLSVAKVLVPAPFVGKSVGEINLRPEYNVNLVAVHTPQNEEDEYEVNNQPNADTVLKKGDIMVLVGEEQFISRISKLA